ncbi:MAG: lysylphosphatidylglycerol synthase transmembrane domain-containing protein [Gemmatimonadales bacterium]
MKKHWGKLVAGLVITIVLLWFALNDVDFGELWANIRGGNPWLLLAAVAVATFGFFIRALRWNVLLAPVKPDTRLRSRFAGVSIGFMANNVLPARVGEFARAYAFSRMEPVTASAAFGTLVVERFMDGVVLLLFLILPIFSAGFPEGGALSGGAGGTVLRAGVIAVVIVLLVLIVLAAWPRAFARAAHAVAGYMPKSLSAPMLAGLDAFLGSITIMRNPKLLALGFLWTLGFWAWHGVSFWLAMLAFDIHTGFMSAIFTEALVGFGVALPAAPGFFGTFHFSANVALSDVYGVPEAQSLAFAFGYHFGGWVPITAIGLWYAGKLGLSLGDVGAAEERVEREVGHDTDESVRPAARPVET